MYNHTGLQGRLTATPELRYTPSGTAITSFTLASDTGRKTKDGNRITNFIDCVAWRQQAEFACKYLTKGRLVIVDGELTSRTYEDTLTTIAEITAETASGASQKYTVHLKKGKNRIKVVAGKDTKLDIELSIPIGEFEELGF